MVRVMDAKLATNPDDAHAGLISDLFVSCCALKSFPSLDELAATVDQVTAAIRTQARSSKVSDEATRRRLRRVARALRSAVKEREALP